MQAASSLYLYALADVHDGGSWGGLGDVLHVIMFKYNHSIAGGPPMDPAGAPVEQVMPVPPMDGTADHPDLYIPEPVRHFLPYFHKQVMEKVAVCTCVYNIHV